VQHACVVPLTGCAANVTFGESCETQESWLTCRITARQLRSQLLSSGAGGGATVSTLAAAALLCLLMATCAPAAAAPDVVATLRLSSVTPNPVPFDWGPAPLSLNMEGVLCNATAGGDETNCFADPGMYTVAATGPTAYCRVRSVLCCCDLSGLQQCRTSCVPHRHMVELGCCLSPKACQHVQPVRKADIYKISKRKCSCCADMPDSGLRDVCSYNRLFRYNL
jgi:hypothetical protein